MYEIFKKIGNNQELETLTAIEKNCWINLENPTTEEINQISEVTEIPADILNAALDENEYSRIEAEDHCILVVINTPMIIEKSAFDTIPLGIIYSKDYFITVSLGENRVMNRFTENKKGLFSTGEHIEFLFLILLSTAKLYLRYMRYINRITDDLEKDLRKSMKNKTLFQMFELERSLIYFLTALKDNNIVTQKLLRLEQSTNFSELIYFTEKNKDLLEDVLIENKQALEMVEIHSNVLSGMMDAFASIISNNLNIVMKFLTSVTILLAIPTMLSSFWGMNVPVPFGHNIYGFFFVVVLAIAATTTATVLLWKKRMF